MQPDYIWKPKLFLNDSHFHYGLGTCHETNCLIQYDGDVICQFPCHQSARCQGDFTDWPMDTQTCDVVFRTFLSQEEVSFDSEELSGSIVGNYNKVNEAFECFYMKHNFKSFIAMEPDQRSCFDESHRRNTSQVHVCYPTLCSCHLQTRLRSWFRSYRFDSFCFMDEGRKFHAIGALWC